MHAYNHANYWRANPVRVAKWLKRNCCRNTLMGGGHAGSEPACASSKPC